jgi:ABC-type transport system substrate-binding protein
VHVRKAFNLALDKAGMRTLRGGESVGEIAGHIMVNSLEDNLLVDYDPYATPNSAGDITAAQAEMAQSKYDTNQDGVCDAPECSGILAVTDEADPYPDQSALIQQNMEPLGLQFDVKSFERGTMYSKCNAPADQVAICLAPAWGKDFPDGYTFADPLFGSAAIFPSCCNYSLVGASPDLLTENGYAITTVDSADDAITTANQQTGDARFQAWADLDVLLMEQIVPWAPYVFDNSVDVTSARINNYSFDQFAGVAAIDAFAIAPEAQ